jgi:hypothetical protein
MAADPYEKNPFGRLFVDDSKWIAANISIILGSVHCSEFSLNTFWNSTCANMCDGGKDPTQIYHVYQPSLTACVITC